MSLVGVVQRLERADVPRLDGGGVSAALRDLDRLKGFIAATELELASRSNALAAQGMGAPVSEVLGASGRISRREADRTSRRAEALDGMPAMAGQLGKGRIGTEHADALATALGRLGDAERDTLRSLDSEMAVDAASSTPGQFKRKIDRVVDQLRADQAIERSVRQRAASTMSKGINQDSGMYWLRAELDPESGARLFGAIDAETDALAKRSDTEGISRDRLAAGALVDLVTSTTRSRRPGRVELLAVVSLDALTDGLADASVCELGDGTEMPVETIRRLACDAHIIPVVLNGDGMALDVGRSRRLATDDQRRALRAMYRTCGVGNCDVPFDRCEIHHLIAWGRSHGETDLGKLLPACSRHHHLAHEGAWVLDLDPVTRELAVTLPDGTLHSRSRPDSVTAATVGRAA